MAFPKKFRELIEIENGDIETPDYLWLTYAVCAVNEESCGWGGWMVEAVFKQSEENHNTITRDKILPSVDEQICPICKGEIYRTGANFKFDLSKDQETSLIEGEDYIAIPPEFK